MNRFQMKGQQVEVHVLTLVNWVKITEDLSKIVQGELFGTFHNQYQIIPNKDTYFVRLAYPVKIFPLFQRNSSEILLELWKITGKWLEQMEPLEFLWNSAGIPLKFSWNSSSSKYQFPLNFTCKSFLWKVSKKWFYRVSAGLADNILNFPVPNIILLKTRKCQNNGINKLWIVWTRIITKYLGFLDKTTISKYSML